MRIRIAVPEAFAHPDVIDAALEAVTRLDDHMIRAGQSPTSHELIAGGAHWRPEDPGDEHFDHGGTIARRGHGDCDDWAPLHAATLRASGEDPGARAVVVPSGPQTYHAIVQRSDGAIDDPSIAAGMRASRVSGAEVDPDRIQIWACDPHDGRLYQGQLLPTVAPLSVHCGPGVSVRGAIVNGVGNLYEGRCDLPISGSPLVHVHSYWRHKGKRHHGRRVRGAVTVVGSQLPYAFSVTHLGTTPAHALSGAIVGALMCGDAAELSTSLDKYKLLGTQLALAQLTPGQVHEALVAQMRHDLETHAAATGTHPREHTQRMLAELAQQGIITGCVIGADGYIVGDFFGDIGKIASGVVHAVSDVANTVAKVANVVPWGDIIHGVQAAVSVVPGLGTAVSDVIAAAETAYDSAAALMHGNPLEAAIHAAYNFALSSVPGAAAIRPILDPTVNALINMAAGHEPIESAALDALLNALPDAPKIGPISPRSIAASLAHLIVSHTGVKHTKPGTGPKPPPHPPLVHVLTPQEHAIQAYMQNRGAVRAVQAAKAPPKPPPPKPAAKPAPPKPPVQRVVMHAAPKPPPPKAPPPAPKPPGIPHAAVHADHPALPAPPKVIPPPQVRPAAAAPPNLTWHCTPGPGGTWGCKWT